MSDVTGTKSGAARFLPALLTIGLAAAMTGAAEGFQDSEIIFPEIAALSLGYVFSDRRAWCVNSKRMFLLISLCAVLGFCLSVFLPGPLYLKILLAYCIAQLIYLYSGTGLAPLISAVVLPVLIGTREVSYMISAAVMTLLVILCHHLLVYLGIRKEEPYTPVPRPGGAAFARMALRLVVVALLGIPALIFGYRFLVAPPLLVAFTELVDHWRPGSEKKPWKVVLLLTICGAAGAGCRGLFTVCLGLPLTLSAVIAVILMLLVVSAFRLYMPPAGAMMMLAMLIPESALVLYVPEVFAAAIVFMGTAVLWNSRKRG